MTHTIVVERDVPYAAQFGHLYGTDDPDLLTWRIECSDPAGCPGWQECMEDHSAATEDDQDDGEMTLHGVLHTYRYGWGWTVEYDGCPVTGADLELPDDLRPLRIGRYPVAVDWEDDSAYLSTIPEETPCRA